MRRSLIALIKRIQKSRLVQGVDEEMQGIDGKIDL